MRWRVTGPILAGLMAMMTSCAQTSDESPAGPTALVERFFTALEAGDSARFMALLDDDFVFRDPDSTFVVRKAAIPSMLEWDMAAGAHPVVSELRASGDTVHCTVRETNAFTDLLGLDPYVLDLTFVVREGRIREEVVSERVADGRSYTERFNEAVAPALAWAERNDPEALGRIRDETGMRYDGESARALLDVIHAWREATPTDER
ncbi:MAG: nuclear transport factor 2 family protein [Gemmatimonadota bacterium]